ncbi:MAG: DUF4340 domain-containing protein [Bariatricus sp.]
MNRSKRLYVLLGILVVVCAVTFAVCKYEETKEKIKNSDEIILEVNSEDVTALSWECDSVSLAFHKDENWIYDEDEAFPVSEEKINDLLEMFQEFGVSFIIEEVEDFGQYGLDEPVCTIHIETEDQTYEIKLGDYSTMDSERYVSVGDDNVYLVKEDPLDSFDIELSDMIDDDDIPDFDDAEVSEITFAGSEVYTVSYEEDSKDTYCEDDVYFTKKEGKKRPLDTSRVESYLDTVSDMDQSEYVTYNASDEDLEAYGLDNPELTVTVQYTMEEEDSEEKTEGTFTLNVSRDPKEAEDAKKSDEDDEEEEITAYARIGESRIVYKITADDYKDLMKASYNDLRHQEVLSADFDDIEKIEISLEGEEYTITSTKKKDERTYYYGDEELEIDDFESALESLKADSFTDQDPDGKEEISLTVYLDNENYPEVKIELYRYDGSLCLAVVDGETVSLVERNQVVDLVEAVNAIVLNETK